MPTRDFVFELKLLDPKLDIELLQRAYDVAGQAHRGQMRSSGEPYLEHSLEVARILGGLQLDTVTVAAGLLHDVLEDSPLSVGDLRRIFSPELASLVDGVTNVGELKFSATAPGESRGKETQAENHRKLFLSMAKDLRVVLVKLADRLHNMRTLGFLEPDRIQRIALETRELYAPLAHRLGMAKIGWELEDLALKYLEPDDYLSLVTKVGESRKAREGYLKMVEVALSRLLQEAGIEATVSWRPKHLYSIQQKMRAHGLTFEEIDDLLALRVITRNVSDCYHALGIVHTSWAPAPGRFTDYVASPKSNMYQSLHTTVIGPLGRKLEIQIRTAAMHRTAEEGIAAHWHYKEKGKEKGKEYLIGKFAWLKRAFEWLQDNLNSQDFLELLKIDLFQDEVFVFTPRGDVKRLPLGATVLDFAFAVHTQVGLHAARAKVNGRIAHLSDGLQNGDVVEITTSPAKKPSQDWLGIVRSAKAKAKLRTHFQAVEDQERQARGWRSVQKELRRRSILKEFERKELSGEPWVQELLRKVASGDLTPGDAVRRIFPERAGEDTAAPALAREKQGTVGIRGIEERDLLVSLAKCCLPVPGDEIVGFVTRGRGVSVHRRGCPNLPPLAVQRERAIPLRWERGLHQVYIATIEVLGEDRPGILAEVARAISESGANIAYSRTEQIGAGGRGQFRVEIRDTDHLSKVIESVGRLPGVSGVRRIFGGFG